MAGPPTTALRRVATSSCSEHVDESATGLSLSLHRQHDQAAGSCCASPYIDTQWRMQRGMRAMHPPMAYSNFLPVKKLPATIAYMVYLLVIWSWQTVTNRSNFLTQMHKKRLATGLPRARRKRGLSALPRPSS